MSNLICEYPDRLREIKARKALQNPEPEERLLSREDASGFLKISLSTLDRHIKTKTLPVIYLGRRIFFLKSSLEQYLRDKQVLPDDFIPRYSPEFDMTYEEAVEVQEKSGRLMKVAKLLEGISKQEMDGKVEKMSAEQKADFLKIKKAVWQEFDFLSKELDELEQIRIERFKKKYGIKSEGL